MPIDSLDDIFADEQFDELVALSNQPKKTYVYDGDIERFQEIIDWVKEHGREPVKGSSVRERQLAVRLDKYRNNQELKEKVAFCDELGLLGDKLSQPASLDEILSDSFLVDEVEDDLFNVSRYKDVVKNRDKVATRKRVKSGFDVYDQLFKSVHKDISTGRRQIKPFKLEDKGHKQTIVKGYFYIDNGLMLYVNRIYDENGNDYQESNNRKLKVHTIYENGTENHIWLLSLVSSLYDSKRNGRRITEKDIALLDDESHYYQTTGYIYVVKYAGDDAEIKSLDNLYKIGRAKDVQKRLANTINESAYLYAPVQLVESFEIQNMSTEKVETYLHHVFSDKRLVLKSQSPTGKMVESREWFIAPLEEVKREIYKIIPRIS